jgi:hypothetical protein
MTNCDLFRSVFLPDRKGQTFTPAQIKEIMLAESDIVPGSILPNDHAEGNLSPCRCAKNRENDPIFDREPNGNYRVS